MSLSLFCSTIKQHLAKEGKSCAAVLIGFCYFFACVLLIIGSIESYKLNSFLTRHCQIKSIDLEHRGHRFYPRLNMTIMDENKIKNDSIMVSIGTSSEKRAWTELKQYKVNETYLCYRSRNEKSVIQWKWQMNKPIKFKGYALLFGGGFLFVTGTILLTLRLRYQKELQNIQ